jgi:phenylacetate-coenzyme A ligase PaaK-like adenylate-forming protein
MTKKLNLYAGDDSETMIDKLNAFQPEVLIGYSSIVDSWASAQLEGRLRISPRVVTTNSELRTAAMEDNIEKAWGVKPFSQYSMTELLSLSSDCEHHRGMHVFEDLGIVEAVDRVNHAVLDGTKSGRILVTNLYNFTQPIIRYEIDDMVTMEGGCCSCGMEARRITTIHGREALRFRFRNRRGQEILVTSLDLLFLLESQQGIQEYQVVVGREEIHFTIVAKEHDRDSINLGLATTFSAHFEKLDIPVPAIGVSFVERVERNPRSGKWTPLIDKTGA